MYDSVEWRSGFPVSRNAQQGCRRYCAATSTQYSGSVLVLYVRTPFVVSYRKILHNTDHGATFGRSFAGLPEEHKLQQGDAHDEFFLEILPVVVEFEGRIGHNWRLRASLIEAMGGFVPMPWTHCLAVLYRTPNDWLSHRNLNRYLTRTSSRFPFYFSLEQVYTCFLPIVMRGMETGVPEVRRASVDAAASFFRYCRCCPQTFTVDFLEIDCFRPKLSQKI